jgi:ABC-type antimicrobial peptide transport system permease subunit
MPEKTFNIMLKNYLLVAIRTLKRNKFYTFINLSGLTIGLTTAIFIFLFIRHELSYEKIHSSRQEIYRIVQERQNSSGINYTAATPYPLREAIHLDFPELKNLTSLHFDDEVLVSHGQNKFEVTNIIFADSNFFRVFDYGGIEKYFLSGNLQRSLNEPGFAILTETQAKTLFPQQEPLGQRISLNQDIDLEVGAIIKDLPANTHLRFNLLSSYLSLNQEYTGFELNAWNFVSSGYTYLRLPASIEQNQFEQSLDLLKNKYYDEESRTRIHFKLQPLDDIHFNSVYEGSITSTIVSRNNLMIIGLIGLFILLIACVNYINLSTAIGLRKNREVGVRKVLGAQRFSLALHYLSKAFLTTLFAGLLSLLLLTQVIRMLNDFLDKEISMNIYGDWGLAAFFILLLLLVSLFSGTYPAFVITRYQPVEALKNKFASAGKNSLWLRRSLVIFQFTIAQLLIIVTLVVSSQMDFIRSKSLGFNKEAVINVGMPESDSLKLRQFYNRLKAETGIAGIAFGLGAPSSRSNIITPYQEVSDDSGNRYLINIKPVDHQYQAVYKIDLLAGRWFNESDQNNSEPKYVVNRKAVEQLGLAIPEEILGKIINSGFGDITGEVIGVTEDIHVQSLHEAIMPVGFVYFPELFYHAGVKLETNSLNASIGKIEKIWNELFPEYLFRYEFLDQALARLYEEENKIFTLFQLFSAIAIFIGCLGLFGLISFLTQQKKKEVGIRIVLGASHNQIIYLFSKEFIILIIVAFILATPVAFLFIQDWLNTFEYKTEIAPVNFIAGCLLTIAIAFFSVFGQSWKASRENPAENLRNE